MEAIFHGAYSPVYQNTPGNGYGYSIIALNYYCDGNTFKTEHETSTNFSISANIFDAEIYESPDNTSAEHTMIKSKYTPNSKNPATGKPE